MRLQNRLRTLQQRESMRESLKQWKAFKRRWCEWRLIDLYAYLRRVNGRKYAACVRSFELFYLSWMSVYSAQGPSRFASHIFEGRMLRVLGHDDLAKLGVSSKEDRREILTRIQCLRGFRE